MLKYLILFCSLFASCFSYQFDLSICTIFRDEAPYLREWIEFHRLVGVQHFYLCNHLSKDQYEEVLEPYIKEGIVELTNICDPNMDRGMNFLKYAIQEPFYTDTIQKARGVSKWVACIDTDEFLVPVLPNSLHSSLENSLIVLLQDYEIFGGLAVNWQIFSTSNIERIQPNELMIEKLIRCSLKDHPWNFHVKSIVQPEKTLNFTSPHFANYMPGYSQVNTDKVAFEGRFSPYVQVDKLRINHYWCRDEYFLRNFKIPRQITLGRGSDAVIQMNKEFNKYTDMTIYPFISELKKRMKLD
jgi:hypothetical protein